jgi:hypothetical protein
LGISILDFRFSNHREPNPPKLENSSSRFHRLPFAILSVARDSSAAGRWSKILHPIAKSEPIASWQPKIESQKS